MFAGSVEQVTELYHLPLVKSAILADKPAMVGKSTEYSQADNNVRSSRDRQASQARA